MTTAPEPARRTSGAACAVGVDVGGTKIAGGIVDLASGQVIERRSVPTHPERGGAAVLESTLALARLLCLLTRNRGADLRGVGLGVAELVDLEQNVTSGHTIDWRGLPVRALLAELAPAAVEADVRAHALGEARYGAGRPFRLWAFVSVGTGISACLVQHGRPLAGARGNALVLASSPLTTTCTHCGTLLQPVLEAFASGPALVARYNQLGGRQVLRGEEVTAAAQAGDPEAMAIVGSAGDALGVSVGWLVNLLDPEALIVGGGLGLAGGLFWQRFEAATRAHIWAESARSLPIIPAALGPDAGLIGAAARAALGPDSASQ